MNSVATSAKPAKPLRRAMGMMRVIEYSPTVLGFAM
jgi:hypothetical protein